jgi:hypothetical protein
MAACHDVGKTLLKPFVPKRADLGKHNFYRDLSSIEERVPSFE